MSIRRLVGARLDQISGSNHSAKNGMDTRLRAFGGAKGAIVWDCNNSLTHISFFRTPVEAHIFPSKLYLQELCGVD